MSNFYVYRKTLLFSLFQFLVDIACLLIVIGLATAGFFIMNKPDDSTSAFIGLGVGLLIGLVITILISYFVTNRIKAAQIAMMAKGVTEESLPEHTIKAGFKEIKGRFGKITLFFVLTNAIKSVFRQMGRGINRLGTAVGGQVGNTVTSVVDSAIQTLVGYLIDCCLAWVFYRSDINGFKAGCEGAVIFFKHGKTLFRNIGRIFGMGLLSFILVGGGLTGIFYLVLSNFPNLLQPLLGEIGTDDIRVVAFVIAAFIGIIIWSILHRVLVRPFILVGVMRNFMKAGKEHVPSEADMAELSSKYPRFSKLQSRAQ